MLSCELKASWEVRSYYDFNWFVEMRKKGIPVEETALALWNKACAEQDTDVVFAYKVSHFCPGHIKALCLEHVDNPPMVSLLMASLIKKSVLLLNHRPTGIGALMPGLPKGIQDTEILGYIDSYIATHEK